MLYIFGDIHLSAMTPWVHEVGEKFISWFDKWCDSINDSDPNILWLGDITEKDVNPGDVVDQEYRLFKRCSEVFNNVYVLMGNHDLKLYKSKAQHSLKFLRNIPHVHIIETPEEFTINNTSIRALPFMRIEGQTLVDYYSNMKFDADVDLVVGHWNKVDKKNPLIKGIDISNMRSKMFCLGHIHTRVDPDYTGSIFPNKVNEEGQRVYKIFNDGKLIDEVELPCFLKYKTITYPEKIENANDGIVYVYEVNGIKSLQAAKQQYPDKYIRGVRAVIIDKETTSSYKSSDIFVYKNNLEAYNDFLKETKYPVSRRASVIINDLLK